MRPCNFYLVSSGGKLTTRGLPSCSLKAIKAEEKLKAKH